MKRTSMLMALLVAALVVALPMWLRADDKDVDTNKTLWIAEPAAGWFLNEIDQYHSFMSMATASSNMSPIMYIQGPYLPPWNFPPGLELIGRFVYQNATGGWVPKKWMALTNSGCIPVLLKKGEPGMFLCSLYLPNQALTSGLTKDPFGQPAKIEVMVVEQTPEKHFISEPEGPTGHWNYLAPDTIAEILKRPHSPALILGDFDRNGEVTFYRDCPIQDPSVGSACYVCPMPYSAEKPCLQLLQLQPASSLKPL